MPATLEEMVSKGTRKLTDKATNMRTNYDGANYRAPDPTRWGHNWRRKVSR